MPKQPIELINIALLNRGQSSKIIKDIATSRKMAFVQKNGKPLVAVIPYDVYQDLMIRGIDLNDFCEK